MISSSVHYQLSIHSWQQHLFDVTLSVPTHDKQSLTFSLPSWIPGSYMIRDFAKNIIQLNACETQSSNALDVIKLDKQRWRVKTEGKATTLHYRVYANDLSVRSAFICDEYAFINGTSAFLRVDELEQNPCWLSVNPTQIPGWKTFTSMDVVNTTNDETQFNAKNYAEFIDHPLFIGRCQRYEFVVGSVTFELLFSGDNGIDVARIANDLTPICQHHMRLFGDPQPIQRYLFMTMVADKGFGGLEHRNSTALLYPRFDLPLLGDSEVKTDGYVTFLSLCSHELFHTWHVKRIKPSVMVNPDLAQETYTNQLWIYEGFTSFYDDLTLARANVIEPQKYIDIVAQNLSRLLQNAGRFKQSAAESSFDAWTKFYKQDASATNNIVSYYTKGGIIAFGLDLLLREQSNGDISLDTVMRCLWEKFGRNETGTPDDVIVSLCQQEFNIDVSAYVNSVVYGNEDVPLEKWLATIGLAYRTRVKVSPEDKGGKTSVPGVKRQLGASCKPASLGLTVVQVFDDLAAARAGIMINDTIIAINGYVVDQAKLQRLLDTSQTQQVTLTLIRDGRLITVTLDVINARHDMAYFDIIDSEKFAAWLHGN